MEATAGGSFRLDCFHSTGIIERLQDSKNYGALGCVDGIGDAVSQKQMESLGRILLSLKTTMEEFHSIVLSLEKLYLDGRQLVKGGFQSIHGEAAAAKSWCETIFGELFGKSNATLRNASF